MTYDSARGVAVLFGGQGPGGAYGYYGDTWEWSGDTYAWTLVHPGDPNGVEAPSPRGHADLVYDSWRGVCVLFGGCGQGDVPQSDTWEWNGISWTERLAPGPSPRWFHGMAYDSVRREQVLFGGYTGYSHGWLGDTWVYTCSASQMDLDVVYASSGGVPVVYDHFDDGELGAWWFVVSGSPGPEHGTVLEMRPGDFIYTMMMTEPGSDTLAVAAMNLIEFPTGAWFGVLVTGDEPGDLLLLLVIPDPGLAILLDEEGVLGCNPVDTGPTAVPLLFMGADGNLIAKVGADWVYLGANTLGTPTGIGILCFDNGVLAESAADLSELGSSLLEKLPRFAR